MPTASLRSTLVVALAALASFRSAQKQSPDEDQEFRKAVEQILASPGLAPVREAERIEALPVRIIGDGLSSRHEVLERPIVLDPKTMRETRKTISTASSYLGGPMACMFQPGLALRFYKGSTRVQVLVCFMCDELVFEPRGRSVAWQDKLMFSTATRAHLLAVAKLVPK